VNDIDSAPQVVFKTRSVANAATTFVIQMKGWCAANALENNRASQPPQINLATIEQARIWMRVFCC
jgi:hypothetical protein